VPKINPEKDTAAPKPYSSMQVTVEEAVHQVIESAGRTLVIFSGGEMQGEGDIIQKARIGMEAGGTGLIFGRNVWQRPYEEALELSRRFKEMLQEYSAE